MERMAHRRPVAIGCPMPEAASAPMRTATTTMTPAYSAEVWPLSRERGAGFSGCTPVAC